MRDCELFLYFGDIEIKRRTHILNSNIYIVIYIGCMRTIVNKVFIVTICLIMFYSVRVYTDLKIHVVWDFGRKHTLNICF